MEEEEEEKEEEEEEEEEEKAGGGARREEGGGYDLKEKGERQGHQRYRMEESYPYDRGNRPKEGGTRGKGRAKKIEIPPAGKHGE